MRFKDGDRVTLVEGFYDVSAANPLDVGGTVSILDRTNMFEGNLFVYSVDWDNGSDNHYCDNNLRPLKIKATKLARKMYPNAKVEGEWLWRS